MPVAVAAGGIDLADLVVLLILVCIALMLWTIIQVRGPLGRVPVVGGPGVSILDGFGQTVANMGKSLEGFLEAQQKWISSAWAFYIAKIVNPYFVLIQTVLIDTVSTVRQMVQTAIPQLQADVAAIEGQVAAQVIPELQTLANEERQLTLYVTGTVAADLATALNLARQDATGLQDATKAIGQLLARIAALEGTVAALVAYAPILQRLAAFEAGALGGLTALEGEIALQRGRIQIAESDLAKLLALLGLSALGAIAIDNLIRLARDPCYCLTTGDFSDLPGRVEALENFGP